MAGHEHAQDDNRGAVDGSTASTGPPTAMRELQDEERRSEEEEGVDGGQQAQDGDTTACDLTKDSSIPRPSLLSLPAELLDLILSDNNLPRSSLPALSSVCRAFRVRLRPRIWRSMTCILAVGTPAVPFCAPWPKSRASFEVFTAHPALAELVQDLWIEVSPDLEYEVGADREELERWGRYLFPFSPPLRNLLNEEDWSLHDRVIGALAARSVDIDAWVQGVFALLPSLRSLAVLTAGQTWCMPYATLRSTSLPHLTNLEADYIPDFSLYPSIERLTWKSHGTQTVPFLPAGAHPPPISLLDIEIRAIATGKTDDERTFTAWLLAHTASRLRRLSLYYHLADILQPAKEQGLVFASLAHLKLFLGDETISGDEPHWLHPFSTIFPFLSHLEIWTPWIPDQAGSKTTFHRILLAHLPHTLRSLLIPLEAFRPAMLIAFLTADYSPSLRRLHLAGDHEESAEWSGQEGNAVVERCADRGIELKVGW